MLPLRDTSLLVVGLASGVPSADGTPSCTLPELETCGMVHASTGEQRRGAPNGNALPQAAWGNGTQTDPHLRARATPHPTQTPL